MFWLNLRRIGSARLSGLLEVNGMNIRFLVGWVPSTAGLEMSEGRGLPRGPFWRRERLAFDQSSRRRCFVSRAGQNYCQNLVTVRCSSAGSRSWVPLESKEYWLVGLQDLELEAPCGRERTQRAGAGSRNPEAERGTSGLVGPPGFEPGTNGL